MTTNYHIDQLISKALKLQANHELDLAINIYQRVLAIDSRNWIAVCNLGVLHSKKGNFGEAIRLISRIKLSLPNSARFIDAYRELGMNLYLKGYKNQALEWLNLVIELNPDDSAVRKLIEVLTIPEYLTPYAHDLAQGKWLKRYSPYEKNNYIYAIDIVGTCNLRCPSCPVGNMPNEPRAKGFMTLELFQEILQKIKKESPVVNPEIWLFNWGEPLLHPKIREIIEMVHSFGWSVMISTNLNVKRGLEDVAISAPKSIKISISGVTDKNYSITHEKGDIELVKENLILLKKYIEQHQSHLSQEKKTNVYLGFHLYKDNLDEAVIAANLAKELGFGFVQNPAIIQPVEKMMAILEDEPTPVDDNLVNKLLVHPKILTKNISSKRSGNYDCELRFNMTSINHDGSVGLCCSTYSNENQIAPDFMKISHQELETLKYSNDFCKKCSDMNLNYSLCDVISE
jgi:MoaA/NifB/PqqE/SkfB family radical SAM enzyme